MRIQSQPISDFVFFSGLIFSGFTCYIKTKLYGKIAYSEQVPAWFWLNILSNYGLYVKLIAQFSLKHSPSTYFGEHSSFPTIILLFNVLGLKHECIW